MTELTAKALDLALVALRRLEWSGANHTKCPACGRPKSYGAHVCSCPIALAFKAATKAGAPLPPPLRDHPPQQPCADEAMDSERRAPESRIGGTT